MLGLSACDTEEEEVDLHINGGDVVIELGVEYVDQGAEALTSSGESLNVDANHNVNTDQVGTYEVIYTTEFNDTILRWTRLVEVIDPELEAES